MIIRRWCGEHAKSLRIDRPLDYNIYFMMKHRSLNFTERYSILFINLVSAPSTCPLEMRIMTLWHGESCWKKLWVHV